MSTSLQTHRVPGSYWSSCPPDTLDLFFIDPNGTRIQIPLTKRGIAWWTDKHVKFRNPGGSGANLTSVFQGKQPRLRGM